MAQAFQFRELAPRVKGHDERRGGDIPLALFAFNVGVECGQLAFVAAVLSVAALARRVGTGLHVERYVLRLAPYAIGSLAAFWSFERLARF